MTFWLQSERVLKLAAQVEEMASSSEVDETFAAPLPRQRPVNEVPPLPGMLRQIAAPNNRASAPRAEVKPHTEANQVTFQEPLESK